MSGDGSQIRRVILEIVAERDGEAGTLQAGPVLGEARRRLYPGHAELDDEQALLTAWYDLFRTGLLSWGYNLQNPNPPFLRTSEVGRRALAQLSRDPYNPDGYLGALRSDLGLAPPISMDSRLANDAVVAYRSTRAHGVVSIHRGLCCQTSHIPRMGETRVNLFHILEDLRDAYPGTVEETIVTEVVANSLDSGARRISITTDSAAATLTVADDGSGMGKAALARYHDLAASTKSRGRSIGFAGVGIKLGLLVSDEVVTESERKRSHRATTWRLSSKTRAPWRWIEPPGLQRGVGTTVRLYLSNAFSTLLEPGFIESTLLSHFRTLFDPALQEILEPHYGPGVDFALNGRPIARFAPERDRVRIEIRVGRQRKASGVGYLLRSDALAEDERGVAVSTRGKVIKRGWDWLGLSPADADHVTGLVEIPSLVEALTLNKADFVRRGDRAQPYLAYRKAVQDVVSAQLREWGETPRPAGTRPRRTRSLERDLRSVIAGLADDFPVLTTLAERVSGGQKRLPLGGGAVVGARVGSEESDGATRPGSPASEAAPTPDAGPPTESLGDRITRLPVGNASGKGKRRPVRLGLKVRFESRPDDPELGRLLESTVWVNDAHPAYHRAVASRSEGYHIALTAAMSLARLAVVADRSHDFVTAFMAEWGRAGNGTRG